MPISEFNFSAHSPQFIGGPLDGSAYNIPPATQAVEMVCGMLLCRYERADIDTFTFQWSKQVD